MNTLLDKLTETIDRLSIIYDELLETAKNKTVLPDIGKY